METKVEVELPVQLWYGRVMKEADRTAHSDAALPRCQNGHAIERGEDYVVIVRPDEKTGTTLCLRRCGGGVLDHLRLIAESSGKLGHHR